MKKIKKTFFVILSFSLMTTTTFIPIKAMDYDWSLEEPDDSSSEDSFINQSPDASWDTEESEENEEMSPEPPASPARPVPRPPIVPMVDEDEFDYSLDD